MSLEPNLTNLAIHFEIVMSIEKTIQEIREIIIELENKGIAVTPVSDAISSLESQAENIRILETSIEAIRSETISPVNNEISTGHKLSRLGYYVGLCGFLLAIISTSFTFSFQEIAMQDLKLLKNL